MKRYQPTATRRYRVVVIIRARNYQSKPIELLAYDEWNAGTVAMLKHPRLSPPFDSTRELVTYEVETLS